jgi:hypothetical protein
VDEPTRDVEREAQKPQNQKNHEDCPKHVKSLLRIAGARRLRTAGAPALNSNFLLVRCDGLSLRAPDCI